MEGRKLQLAGGSTYLVSLPKRWVVKAGLKAGDTVFVDMTPNGTVSVFPKSGEKPQVRRKIFDEREDVVREHLLRKLVGAYVSGYGLIEVRFPPHRAAFVRQVAREFCRLVIGPEVIEEGRNMILVQDLSDAKDLSSEKCLRRMHLTVRVMLEDAVTALKTSNETTAKDVADRSQDVNRLYWVVAKQYHLAHLHPLQSPSNGDASSVHAHRLVAKLLERIGFHAERIASTFPVLAKDRTIDPKIMKEIEEARTSVVELLDKAFQAVITHDMALANRTIDARVDYQKLVDGLSHRVATRRGEELLALGSVVDSLGRVAAYSAEIAEQAIDLAVLSEPVPP